MSEIPINFSVVIPTFNRPTQLFNCLAAIAKQQYAKQLFEVIIVNDGGAALDDVIRPFQQALTITLISQQNAGPAMARNRGAAIARGDFLVFTDDDCCCPQDWLQQLDKHCLIQSDSIQFDSIQADSIQPDSSQAGSSQSDSMQAVSTQVPVMLGGQTINTLSENLFSVASQMIVDLAYQYFNPCPEQASFFASSNMVFPRAHFLKLGGFHPAFRTSEDREICDRWLRSGYRMQYASEVTIYHAHHLTLFSFWRQHLSYGRGAYCYHTIRTQRGEPPFRPDLSFHRQLLTHPFKALPWYQAPIVVGLMILSQFASLVGYQQEKIRFSQTSNERDETFLPLSPLKQET